MPPKQKAMDKKALLEADKGKKAAQEQEQQAEQDWSVGAKSNSKAKAAEEADEEKRRKAAEKKALLDADEEETGKIVVKKKTVKKKGKDDFDLLNDAIAKQPKTKAMKEKEEKQRQDLERRKQEEEKEKEKRDKRLAEQAEVDKLRARGIVSNQDDLFVPINNRLPDDDEDGFNGATGIEGSLALLDVDGKPLPDEHPERRQKALYYAYYSKELPLMRQAHPGLRLTQYKEHIFQNWQKSPENPSISNPKAKTVFDFAA